VRILNRLKRRLKRAYLSIGSSRQCPLCSWTGHSFLIRTMPNKPQSFQICPQCDSWERHRFAYVALKDRLPKGAMLHVSPEKCLGPWLKCESTQYLGIDLYSTNEAVVNMDITNLDLPDSSYDLVWCSHVLEHVQEDAKAMSEFRRVLRPGGTCIIMVPIYGDATYEDASIVSPEERLKHFLQPDHVRIYGLDIVERLQRAGFTVEVVRTELMDSVERFGLDYPSTREIFVCRA